MWYYVYLKMKIILSDWLMLTVFLMAMIVVIVTVVSAAFYVQTDEVVIGMDSSTDEEKLYEILAQTLVSMEDTIVVPMDFKDGMEALTEGHLDLYVELSDDASTKIAKGDTDGLVTLYTDGISIYSVFYPDLMLGSLMKEIQLGVVQDYLAELNADSEISSDEADVMAREIHDSIYAERDRTYYIETWENGEQIQTKDTDDSFYLIFVKKLIIIVFIIIHIMITLMLVNVMDEREFNVMKRLDVTPIHKFTLLCARWLVAFLPVLLIACALATIVNLIVVGKVEMNIYIWGKMAVSAGVITWIELLVIRLARTTASYVLISAALIMLFGTLGGAFFEVSLIGGPIGMLRWLSPYEWASSKIIESVEVLQFQ